MNPSISADNPFKLDQAVPIIEQRLRERRLLEAQFLFDLLDENDLSGEDRVRLEQELALRFQKVHSLHQQARRHAGLGNVLLARQTYKQIEEIVVDIPEIAAERHRLEQHVVYDMQQPGAAPNEHASAQHPPSRHAVAEQYEEGERKAAQAPLPQRLEAWCHELELAESMRRAARKTSRHLRRMSRLKLVALLALCLLLPLLFFFSKLKKEYSDASLRAKALSPITIKPLSVQEQRNDEANPSTEEQAQPTPLGAASDKEGNIRINELKIQPKSTEKP